MTFLGLEIAADRLLGTIAEEAALADRDLDAIEERLLKPNAPPGEVAALALTLGRAGRAASAPVLGATRARLGAIPEAKAITVALELLSVDPPRWLERAESGYRRVDPLTQEELFVEDPLAAHWHRNGRWGPPLRVDHRCPVFDAAEAASAEELVARVRGGSIALVTFPSRGVFAEFHPAVRLARAGLTLDPSLRHLVRWTAVRSIGTLERRFSMSAAYEDRCAPVVFAPNPSIGTPALVQVMTALADAARQ